MLDFWDTAGQEKFKTLAKFFYINTGIFLMFYDSLDKSSFERIKEHFINSKKIKFPNEPIYALIRSKYDLNVKSNEYRDIITDEEVLEFADENNINFFHLSNFEKY